MGAFIIITIILMPDYQKEVRSQGDLEYLEELAGKTQAILDQTEEGSKDILEALLAAQTRHQQLQARQEVVSSELETLNAQQQARNDQPPPPPPAPEEAEEELGSRLVTFRFLGLKSDKTRFLLLIDMNKYLGEHRSLIRKTVARALDSLQPGYQFGILGFQQLDSGPRYHHWPAAGLLATVTRKNQTEALGFISQLSTNYGGASSLRDAFRLAFENPAEAIILFSDGLPNPDFNNDLPPRALVQDISLSNVERREIHAVTIGDYFKYKGTVEFMESLARANSGGFLALAQ
jgi:hypothetical protein